MGGALNKWVRRLVAGATMAPVGRTVTFAGGPRDGESSSLSSGDPPDVLAVDDPPGRYEWRDGFYVWAAAPGTRQFQSWNDLNAFVFKRGWQNRWAPGRIPAFVACVVGCVALPVVVGLLLAPHDWATEGSPDVGNGLIAGVLVASALSLWLIRLADEWARSGDRNTELGSVKRKGTFAEATLSEEVPFAEKCLARGFCVLIDQPGDRRAARVDLHRGIGVLAGPKGMGYDELYSRLDAAQMKYWSGFSNALPLRAERAIQRLTIPGRSIVRLPYVGSQDLLSFALAACKALSSSPEDGRWRWRSRAYGDGGPPSPGPRVVWRDGAYWWEADPGGEQTPWRPK